MSASGQVRVIHWDLNVRVGLRDGFFVDTDRTRLDLAKVHEWLSTDAYWAIGRPLAVVEQAAEASINFGVYDPDGDLVGYARVLTDGVTFGWLCDVYIVPQMRGRGLGTALSQVIGEAIRPLGLKRLMLATADAQGVYAKVGFTAYPDPQMLMVLGSEGALYAKLAPNVPQDN